MAPNTANCLGILFQQIVLEGYNLIHSIKLLLPGAMVSHLQLALSIRSHEKKMRGRYVRTQLEPVFGGHVGDQVDDALGVSPLVVIPGNEFDKVVVQGDASLGVEDTRVVVTNKVGGHDVVLGIVDDALLFD